MGSVTRLSGLDGLRGLAGLGVLTMHVWMFDYGDAGRPDKTILDRLIAELRIGLPLFFALSGFLIARPFVAALLERRPLPALGPYALRRAARILPAYWLALIGALLVVQASGHPLGVPGEQVALFVVLAQNFAPQTALQLDPPMWSLSVEATFYALLPLLALVGARVAHGRRGALLAGCAALVAGQMVVTWLALRHGWPRTVTTSLPFVAGEFAAGIAAAVCLHGRRVRRPRRLVGAGVALVLLNALWHGWGLGPFWLRSIGGDLPGAAGVVLVIIGVAHGGGRILDTRVMQRLGEVAYGTYLWHFLVVIALRSAGLWPENLVVALLATAGPTLVLAALSWRLVERPAIDRAAARTRRPATRGSRFGAAAAPGRS